MTYVNALTKIKNYLKNKNLRKNIFTSMFRSAKQTASKNQIFRT